MSGDPRQHHLYLEPASILRLRHKTLRLAVDNLPSPMARASFLDGLLKVADFSLERALADPSVNADDYVVRWTAMRLMLTTERARFPGGPGVRRV